MHWLNIIMVIMMMITPGKNMVSVLKIVHIHFPLLINLQILKNKKKFRIHIIHILIVFKVQRIVKILLV